MFQEKTNTKQPKTLLHHAPRTQNSATKIVS
nr:MAG TPA: hypothetical protein [Caudoviricetes sp.]